MRRSSLTIFFAGAVIVVSFIAGFFAWQNQKLVEELREKSKPTMTAEPTTEPSPTAALEMANPAAVFCLSQGGQSTIKTAKDGSQSGLCTIDGKVYDEWEYFRKSYGPSTASPTPTPCSQCQP